MFKRFLKKSDSYSGKQKACSFDFVAISSYFQYKDHREEYSIISDQTFSDLGLDELFMFVDRTSSRVGQQYLYDMLRIIPAKANPIQENEAIIQELFEKEETRSALTDILSDLSAAEGYSIVSLHSRSHLNKRNLFLLDEIFKGTNTTERIASAKAVLSYLNADNNLIFVSTHDTELATLLEKEYDLYHFCETIDNEELSFDYQLKCGKLTRRNAIRILEINNFPSNLIQDAYDTASKLENHIGI